MHTVEFKLIKVKGGNLMSAETNDLQTAVTPYSMNFHKIPYYTYLYTRYKEKVLLNTLKTITGINYQIN